MRMSKFIDENLVDEDDALFTEDEFRQYKEDDWADELRLKLEQAIEVWIASAYMDFRGVEVLKSTIESLPPGSSREFRILLDEEFHSNEVMREVIINQLYQLPNTIIRIANTKGKFHPKCYVFNNGSVTNCLVGSMNLTGAALVDNVEFGISINESDPANISKCRNFFINHWSKANTPEKTDLLKYISNKYNILERVRYKIKNTIGIVSSLQFEREKNQYLYEIFFNNNDIQSINEDDLEKLPITEPAIYEIFKYKDEVTKNNLKGIIYNYLYSRYLLPAEEGLYIPINCRIYESWYQKIPLLKIISAERPKLLIADEVGLGKTIEAGLIISEMLSKLLLCKRILIICPNNLLNKWEAEMRLRFGLYFDIYKGNDVINFIKQWRAKDSFFAIISYESLRRKEIVPLVKEQKTWIDVLVCDEAHHLRNANNKQHHSVREIAKNNRCMLMLTATPINLSNNDLRVLLGLLDPVTYKRLDVNNWQRFKTPNIFISQLYGALVKALDNATTDKVQITSDIIGKAKAVKTSVLDTKQFGVNYANDHPLVGAINEILKLKENMSVTSEAMLRLMEKVYYANVFAQSITRTLKKDVGEFHVRDIKSIKVTLKYDDERMKFSTLQDEIKKYYNKNKHNKLVAHSYLRQMGSCLPVFNTLNKLHTFKNEDDVEDSFNKDTFEKHKDRDLLSNDSKYECLKEIVQNAKENDRENFKIVIFCVFRKTIFYLKDRLNADFGDNSTDAVHGGIDDSDKRYSIIRKFREENKPNILICSEVASEGIDLQNSKILVNYDLPWNPTRVEQRVGRIDRFGQSSEIIYIYNLVVEGTVEEIIYNRLDKRLEDARNTLGPVAEILSDLEKNLPEYFLQNAMSEQEKQAYLNKLERNLIRAKREEENIESYSLNLSGRGQKYLNEKWNISNYLVDHQERIATYLVSVEKDIFRLMTTEKGYTLKVNRTKKKQLLDKLKIYLIKKNQKKSFDHLLNVIKEDRFDVVLDHDNAMKRGGEYLNINHPIVKVLIKDNGNKLKKGCIYSFESTADGVNAGIYFIIEYKSSITIGRTKQDSCFYQAAFILNSHATFELIDDINTLEKLFDFNYWQWSDKIEISGKALQEAETLAQRNAYEFFEDQFKKMKNKILDEYSLKNDTLEKMLAKEKSDILGKIDSTPDPLKKAELNKLLIELGNQIKKELTDVPKEEDIRFSPDMFFCAKIIRR